MTNTTRNAVRSVVANRKKSSQTARLPDESNNSARNSSDVTTLTPNSPARNNNKSVLRRSSRPSNPTLRGRAYAASKACQKSRSSFFPTEHCDIKVKWIVNSKVFWWPASVLSLNDEDGSSFSNNDNTVRAGRLRYYTFLNYPSECADVVFTYHPSTESRTVHSVSSGHNQASWVYADEDPSDEERDIALNASRLPQKRKPLPNNQPSSSLQHLQVAVQKTSLPGQNSNSDTTSHPSYPPPIASKSKRLTTPGQRVQQHVASQPSPSGRKSRRLDGSRDLHVDDVNSDDDNRISVRQDRTPTTRRRSAIITGNNAGEPGNNTGMEVRISLLEYTLETMVRHPQSLLDSHSFSVLLSLRWSLAKSLEKPLKRTNLTDLSKYGLASDILSVKVQCDHNSFMTIAKYIENMYNTTNLSYRDSRVAFAPPFPVIHSGSQSASDLSIIFATLSDLTHLLNIRDERDYEHIMVKENVTESASFFRLLGTYAITTDEPDPVTSNEQTSSVSVCTTSSAHESQSIRLYVASAPVQVEFGPVATPREPTQPLPSSNTAGFHSVLLTQKCENFSTSKSCFQADWVPYKVRSKFNVVTKLDADCDIHSRQIKDHFVMSWNPAPSPSASKWTSDMLANRGNVPGSITLQVPLIYIESRHNIGMLSKVLDNQIEDLMDLHKSLHL